MVLFLFSQRLQLIVLSNIHLLFINALQDVAECAVLAYGSVLVGRLYVRWMAAHILILILRLRQRLVIQI